MLPLALSAASPVLSPHCTCAWLVTSPIAQTIVLHGSKDQLSCKSGCLKFNVFLCVSEFLQKCDHSFAKSVTWFVSLLLFCLHSAVFTIVCLVFSPNRISPPTSLTLRECVCLLTFGFRATASLLLNIYSAQSGIEAQNNSQVFGFIVCEDFIWLSERLSLLPSSITSSTTTFTSPPSESWGCNTHQRRGILSKQKLQFIYLTAGVGGHKETNCCNRRLLPISGWWMCNICSQEDNWLLKHWWSVDRETEKRIKNTEVVK